MQCKEVVIVGNSCTASCMLSCRHGDDVVVIGEEGHSGTLRDTQGHSGILRDTQGHSGILRDTQGYSGILRDTQGHSP